MHYVTERRDERTIRFREHVKRALHAVDEAGGVRQAAMLGAHVVPFPFLRIQLVEFGCLPFETLALEL